MDQKSKFSKLPPLSLYIHLPWCVRKCPYCDFNSHEQKISGIAESGYTDALISDLNASVSLIQEREISSIFIGGGTPSLFSAPGLEKLLGAIRAKTRLVDDIEVTLEANPGTADSSRFTEYRRIGINRLSIGVQSFNTEHLHSLGRIHDSKQAVGAIKIARDAGFERINLDLMYGLPGQTIEQALEDLDTAMAQDTTHLSWYQLTLEPNTLFYSRPPVLPTDDEIWDMQEAGREALGKAGFEQYEISAYARDRMYCRHNLNYWHFGDYLGIGAGAHSKITQITTNTIARYSRHRNPERYMDLASDNDAVSSHWELSSRDIVLEYMMNALRLSDGVDICSFEEMTGLPFSILSKQLDLAQNKTMLEVTSNKITPTRKGITYLNDLLQCFMPETGSSLR